MDKTKALIGRLRKNELRQSLDPEVELLCMLSPLQVIYCPKKLQAQQYLNSLTLLNSIRVGIHERHSKNDMWD
ncbi:hypothetical protein CDG68_08205 [Acinetobacter wuhouensis]|uniref:Uncharacterized protein n=1 Tax=Acinetobacter wuhouensis TaxID=1879050 RepID=A0A3G2T0E1_9GAMM|nr:hypothetical protein CDG68_08205 [Acinetobacter wuhouensis]